MFSFITVNFIHFFFLKCSYKTFTSLNHTNKISSYSDVLAYIRQYIYIHIYIYSFFKFWFKTGLLLKQEKENP